jgi:hypothetical protein
MTNHKRTDGSNFLWGIVVLLGAWVSGYWAGHGDAVAAWGIAVLTVVLILGNALIRAIKLARGQK